MITKMTQDCDEKFYYDNDSRPSKKFPSQICINYTKKEISLGALTPY